MHSLSFRTWVDGKVISHAVRLSVQDKPRYNAVIQTLRIPSMKLYNFTSNGYGLTWFVCAGSREAAIQACRDAIQKQYDEAVAAQIKERSPHGWELDFENEEFIRKFNLEFLELCIANEGHYPGDDKCSINEIEPGVVIFSEVS